MKSYNMLRKEPLSADKLDKFHEIYPILREIGLRQDTSTALAALAVWGERTQRKIAEIGISAQPNISVALYELVAQKHVKIVGYCRGKRIKPVAIYRLAHPLDEIAKDLLGLNLHMADQASGETCTSS